jgi:hypothetical protein
MRKLRWISILLLVLGAAGLAYKLRADWREFHAVNDPATVKPRPLPPAQAASTAPAPDYTVVAQQNPFHPERNDAMPPPPAVVAKSVGPPPLVYGSMLLGKEKYALMATENDLKPRKVNEGEDFNGYKLAQVKEQSVVLESDGAKSEVMFYNALSRLRRENAVKTQAPPPTVQANAPAPAVSAVPAEQMALPPSSAPAPAGKILVMTPFGPIWQDKKQ